VLFGCTSLEPQRCDLPPPPTQSSIDLPAEQLEQTNLYLLGFLDGGAVSFDQGVTYAIGERFSGSFWVHGENTYIANCSFGAGSVRWKSITQGTGDGIAHAQIGFDDSLLVVLRGPGITRYVLQGEYVQPDGGGGCTVGGLKPTTIPFEHHLTIEVRPVAGIRFAAPCNGPMIVPAGAPVHLPYAQLIGTDGAVFEAANAKRPVAQVLSAPGGVTALDGGEFVFGKGSVTLTAQTSLPVSGQSSFTVVGPEQLTSFDAWFARHSWSKTEEWPRIDGGAIDVSWGAKRLKLVYGQATVGGDALCVEPPAQWYCMRSSTPQVCSDDGAVLSDGNCQLDVTVPGTSWEWKLDVDISGSATP
jgi:hypothetical protein